MSEAISETEEQAKIEASEEEVVNDTDRCGRLRDEKGHFLPSDAAKCKHDKKKTEEKKEDPNVVKIKVVKEKKPKVPKNIIGKLNEMKERNASRFIESVIANNPSRIDIDGKVYYSENYVNKLNEEVDNAQKNEAEAIECMNEMKDGTETLLKASKDMLKEIDDNSIKVRMWKSLAIGLLVGSVIGFSIYMAKVYVAELGKNAPTAELKPSSAR